MLKKIQVVAFDVNGTLIGGNYHLWNKIFDEDLKLKKRENAPPLKWYETQTGKITFEEMVSLTYNVENPQRMKKEAYEVYMSELTLREGCISLLENLNRSYKLIICSDTSGVTKVITKAFDLEKYFTKSFYST
ncbi:MAG: family hydrolase, partial [Thermoproteota archaeon]|nr:family hydrolase [Thermoproteota archaeon]